MLHEQAGRSRTIAEKLEKFSDVGYAFVILSPDDVGGVREELRKKLGAEKSLLRKSFGIIENEVDNILDVFEPRARQNVILELGYFWGLLERKNVCCLLKEKVKNPSDIHGIEYISFKDSVEEVRNRIIKELQEAGYTLKI